MASILMQYKLRICKLYVCVCVCKIYIYDHIYVEVVLGQTCQIYNKPTTQGVVYLTILAAMKGLKYKFIFTVYSFIL